MYLWICKHYKIMYFVTVQFSRVVNFYFHTSPPTALAVTNSQFKPLQALTKIFKLYQKSKMDNDGYCYFTTLKGFEFKLLTVRFSNYVQYI